MVFQTLGEQYGRDGWFKTAVNSTLIYGGLRVGGTVIDRLTGSPTIDTLLDMAAPVATGIYCVSRGPEGALGNAARLGIAGLVGWDIADQLIQYPGRAERAHWQWIRSAFLLSFNPTKNIAVKKVIPWTNPQGLFINAETPFPSVRVCQEGIM